ncbi:hypothetical protein [Streptacidiphilus fuscans]|uniref:Uncharacterized protein n=1 Tax=Streptacidiphilus fuscans TaxID=2789292 RepID=A0A931FEP1_9ACTN|nr:hypothetical protein [Streptacidiphilus fuscans]MBF9068871.1 hypothetical protein [Streptacidiphilus fuscans]
MRSVSHITRVALKGVTVASVVAGAMLATVAPASAHTAAPHSVNPGAVVPQGACGGDPGPFVEVLTNYGTYYNVKSGPFVDDNGTGNNSTTSFSNTWSGTISATINANFHVSESTLVEGVSADLGLSLTASATIGGSHTVTYTVAPHKALHAEYAEFQADTYDETYSLNSVCAKTTIAEGETYFDEGDGWHTWLTNY